ncbi:MAG TPA: class I SAM-dependent methyltransferase [Longimicrobium sp.]|nr:class I SAM-dependent methyltransferase [Longimicrobium sp.]
MDDPRRKWDTVYAAPGHVFGTEPNDFLAQVAHRISPGRVLCLADGEGRNGVHLAALGYEVVSVDVSPVGLSKARRLADAGRVPLAAVAADVDHVCIERGGWSGVVSIFAHLPAELRARIHRRAVRGLAPGGAFVLEAYTPRQLGADGGPKDAGRMMDEPTLRRELSGLRFDVLRELRRELREGPRHNGPGEVVQLLAFKPDAPSAREGRGGRTDDPEGGTCTE